MSRISFFALGGLDEREKECFVLSVNNDYFIFNMGISIPNFSSLGIKKIIPDFDWIDKNKNRIKGIFISTAIFENVGSLLYINNIVNKIPIYTSELGKIIIENFFNKRSMKNIKNFSEYKINTLKPLEEIKIGDLKITPFAIMNSSPNSLGFIFNTNDGAIILLDDFIISGSENEIYKNQINEINKITNNKNLILISSVGNISKPHGFTAPNHNNLNFIQKEINIDHDRRNFVCCYDHDIFTIINLINFAKKSQMKITIHNSVMYNLISKFISLKIIDDKNLLFTSISKINLIEKGIVLISYNKNKLFSVINNICIGNDEFIECKKTDKFILAFNTISGFEFLEANMIDCIAKIDVEWSKLPKNILEMKASSEDHKLLVNSLNPKYIIPTSGLYYEFVDYKNIIGNKSKCIILENGQQVYFENGNYFENKTKWIEIKEKYITSSQEFSNINPSLLNERKLMSENGVVFISILLNKNNGNFFAKEIKINDYGITIDKKILNNEIILLEENITKIINDHINNKDINNKEIKNNIKKLSNKFYEKFLGKTPLVLVTLIDRIIN